jgi:aminopeptidase YwaD
MTDSARARLFADLDFERLAGTSAEERAAEVITKALRGLGVTPVVEPFPVTTFETGTARLTCSGAGWDLHPYGVQGDCAVEGTLRFLENSDILNFNIGSFKDTIVMCMGSSQRIHDLLWEEGVKALVEICGPHREAASLSHRQRRQLDGRAIPSFTVTYDDAEKIAPLDGKVVKIECHQKMQAATAHNLVATLGAPTKDSTLTLLVAHYDSVARSHGASDNAAGVITLLDVVGNLVKTPLSRELRVVLFSGEELGLRGSWAYVKAHEEELHTRGRLVMNLDIAGDPIGTESLFVTGTRELLGWTAGVCREEGLLVQESFDIYSSDNMPFSVYEIPTVSIARFGGTGSYFIHSPGDVAANVSPLGIEKPARAAYAILSRVLNAGVYPVRKEIDDSFREKIERYTWTSTLEKPELKWMEKYRK